jgi:dTDP-4-amino-4,6-dideoxygalactose transaminase
MNEVEAAIGIEQLKKLEYLAAKRAASAKRLTARLRGLEGLQTPFVAEGNTHVYYVYSLILDPDKLGMPRQRIYDALAAEGVPNLMQGYQLLYMLPMYQKRIAFGSKGFPWSSSVYGGNVSYDWGICPAAEALHSSRYLGIGLCSSTYTDAEVDLVAEAFWKVWGNLDALRA